jgi:hypothetical protein
VQARASEWGHPRHEVPKALRTLRTSVLEALISLFKLPFQWDGSFFAAHGLIYGTFISVAGNHRIGR